MERLLDDIGARRKRKYLEDECLADPFERAFAKAEEARQATCESIYHLTRIWMRC